MSYCTNCGKELNDDALFCPACGTKVVNNEATNAYKSSNTANSSDFNDTINNIGDKIKDFANTDDTTYEYDSNDINDNRIFAILSYIGILFVIPLIAAPNSKYARYHTNQGLVLFISSIVLYIIAGIITAIFVAMTSPLLFIFNPFSRVFFTIASLVELAFTILGIVNAATGKAKELPLIGKIKILK